MARHTSGGTAVLVVVVLPLLAFLLALWMGWNPLAVYALVLAAGVGIEWGSRQVA